MYCYEHPSLTFRHRAGIRLYTSSYDFAGPCVFVKQLVEPFYCAHAEAWDALSRSYSVKLPSSFSTDHPSALEYSSRLPVSVCGTGCYTRFSWKGFYGFALSEDWAQRAYPSARNHHGPPSLLVYSRRRNINLLSIIYPFRV